MKLACGETIIPKDTFKEKIQFLESAGYEGIDLVGAGLKERLEEVEDIISKSKIKVGAIYSRLQYPILSSDIREREIAIEQLKESENQRDRG